jgi:maltose alpha-D-glucosyltransferase / alpha-amylase
MKADDPERMVPDDAPHAADVAAPALDPLWYKDAVIYELHIKAFSDANGDGIGDFAGLIDKLDYVRELGVNTIWVLPFYPSPLRDDGYDVADFRDVHPSYGSAHDVARLVHEAHARGLRVITELVVNHTSDQHPWFQAARKAPQGSPERDFYVWSDDPLRYAGTRIIFTDTETSNWTWDPVAGQYFWHRFFSHQPDLNFDNPAVRDAIFEIMDFWLRQGVDGFRLDAIPYLVEREGTSNENLRETHEVIKAIRRRVDEKYPGRLLLAEANMWPEDVREYFGDGDECHMAYHFPLMPRMYMAIAQEDRHPVIEILQQTPDIPAAAQWAIFLRNHDELTLEMVTSKERDYMYSMYAADPRARINLGIRRRLAPLLDNDRERIKLMNSLLLSMPGSPVLYYGDEIGMGDNIFLGDRDGVRTPMQWTGDRNGGFSRADPQRLYLPPIQDPVYGFEAVNVEAQQRDPSSLLNWTRRLLAIRRSTQVFGRGRITLLHPGNRKVLAYLRELDDEVVLCVANLSRSAQPVELDLASYRGRVPVEMAGQVSFPPLTDQPCAMTLPGYGFFWFRLSTEAEPPQWHTRRSPVEDLATLVLFDGWNSLFRDRVVPWRIAMAQKTLAQFETQMLPPFLARQRWFDQGSGAPARVRLAEHGVLTQGGREWLLAWLETPVDGPGGPAPAHWFTPLALGWEEDEEAMRLLAPAALARVREQARVGVMADALADPAFCRAVVLAVGAGRELRCGTGLLRFQPTAQFEAIAAEVLQGEVPLQALPQGHNTIVRIGEDLVLKVLRRVHEGEHPELEIGRFLRGAPGEQHAVPLAGCLQHVAADGSVSTVALLRAHVMNQGTTWGLAIDQASKQLDRGSAGGASDEEAALAEVFAAEARGLALRTADMHAALARRTGDPAFEPEPLTEADLQQSAAQTRARADFTLARLSKAAAGLPAGQQALAQRVSTATRAVDRIVSNALAHAPVGIKCRIHGAYGLQELLRAHDHFIVIDFEGDSALPLAERRRKQSPWRDVAGMLRSFELARQVATHTGSHGDAEQLRREKLGAAWARSVRETFLQAYAEAAQRPGLEIGAERTDAVAPMLALFELDRALQDLDEELRRPSGVPAHALAALGDLLDLR